MLCACLCCAVFFVSTALTADRGRSREERPSPNEPVAVVSLRPQALASVEEVEPAPGYLLRECQGSLWVFSTEDENVPVLKTGIDCTILRSSDRELLRAGLYAPDWEALLLLLEDYGS